MLQLEYTQPRLEELQPVNNPQEFIERMQRKLEVKEALYQKENKRHRFLERLAWLNFDGQKRHLLL